MIDLSAISIIEAKNKTIDWDDDQQERGVKVAAASLAVIELIKAGIVDGVPFENGAITEKFTVLDEIPDDLMDAFPYGPGDDFNLSTIGEFAGTLLLRFIDEEPTEYGSKSAHDVFFGGEDNAAVSLYADLFDVDLDIVYADANQTENNIEDTVWFKDGLDENKVDLIDNVRWLLASEVE
jgi:hypothetical protein